MSNQSKPNLSLINPTSSAQVFIPAPTNEVEELRMCVETLKQAVEGLCRHNGVLGSAVTVKDLVDLGILEG